MGELHGPSYLVPRALMPSIRFRKAPSLAAKRNAKNRGIAETWNYCCGRPRDVVGIERTNTQNTNFSPRGSTTDCETPPRPVWFASPTNWHPLACKTNSKGAVSSGAGQSRQVPCRKPASNASRTPVAQQAVCGPSRLRAIRGGCGTGAGFGPHCSNRQHAPQSNQAQNVGEISNDRNPVFADAPANGEKRLGPLRGASGKHFAPAASGWSGCAHLK